MKQTERKNECVNGMVNAISVCEKEKFMKLIYLPLYLPQTRHIKHTHTDTHTYTLNDKMIPISQIDYNVKIYSLCNYAFLEFSMTKTEAYDN